VARLLAQHAPVIGLLFLLAHPHLASGQRLFVKIPAVRGGEIAEAAVISRSINAVLQRSSVGNVSAFPTAPTSQDIDAIAAQYGLNFA
jgi:hypothetical protein